MEKSITAVYGGTNAYVGELQVNRLLPNRYIHAVGPFVFLDHIYPYVQKPANPLPKNGKFAHPHRGIATFSYLFSGELEHYDSQGNYGIVKAGGAQWMKAGNGIIHDEGMSAVFQQTGGTLHALQFWINLPAENKAERPAYLGLQADEVPEVSLPRNAGKLRILIGEFEEKKSPVETYTKQFAYHIMLHPNMEYRLPTQQFLEYAVFVPVDGISINDSIYNASELVTLDQEGTEITFYNNGEVAKDLIVFGGDPYTEKIVAEGPFVMNSRAEIADAYKDFFNGNYGNITYQH